MFPIKDSFMTFAISNRRKKRARGVVVASFEYAVFIYFFLSEAIFPLAQYRFAVPCRTPLDHSAIAISSPLGKYIFFHTL